MTSLVLLDLLTHALERVYTSAGPSMGVQASDQPGVGCRRCNGSCSLTSSEHLPLLLQLDAMHVHVQMTLTMMPDIEEWTVQNDIRCAIATKEILEPSSDEPLVL